MNRITFTVDQNGHLVQITADEEVEVFIVAPSVPDDRVYRWNSLQVGKDAVNEQIEGWPVGDRNHLPRRH